MQTLVDRGYNNTAASMFGSKPICPSNITLPTCYKALQELMRRRVNLNTWVTLQSVNKVALLTIMDKDCLKDQQWVTATHFTMTQDGFKKALYLYSGHVEKLHSRNAFAPQDIKNLTPNRRRWPLNPS